MNGTDKNALNSEKIMSVEFPRLKTICKKEGMTAETCRYNPRLGCDCGFYPSNKQFLDFAERLKERELLKRIQHSAKLGD